MSKVAIICEGKTERLFVNELIKAYLPGLELKGLDIGKCQGKGCGGGVTYDKFCKDLRPAMNDYDYVTTFFDYYGLGEGWPDPTGNTPWELVEDLEAKSLEMIHRDFPDLKQGAFIPFFALHEFEALLFSDTQAMHRKLRQPLEKFEAVIQECGEPELINNHPDTAPSKRLKSICDNYRKTVKGMRVAREVTVATMREQCPHFNSWLEKLEALVD